MKTFTLRLKGCRKCYIVSLHFHFSKFQMTITKTVMEKPSFFVMDLEGSTTSQIFLIYIVFIFLNKRNITISLLMIHIKYAVVHYDNSNSSSTNKAYLRAVEYYAISFFSKFLFTFMLTTFLSKTL